jgi:hypothetical protein
VAQISYTVTTNGIVFLAPHWWPKHIVPTLVVQPFKWVVFLIESMPPS